MAKSTAIFDGDDSRLAQVIAGIEKRLKRVTASMAEIGATTAKMLAAPAAALAAIGVGVKSALDTGGHFADLSANTGIAVKDLAVLEQEFQNAGKAGEDVGPVIAKMQKALASGAGSDILRQLGVDMEKLRDQTPVEQFHQIGAALNTLQDPTERASAAMEIFGKSGSSLLAMFSSAGFGDAAEQVGTQAEILNRDAALFDDVGDKLGLIGLKVRGFFIGVADKVAPVLKPLLDRFATLDLAAYGQAIGDAFAFLIQAIGDGKLSTILGNALMIAAKGFGNYMLGNIAALGAGLGQFFLEAGKALISVLSMLLTTDFWSGLGNALLAIGKSFIALLLEGTAKMLQFIGRAPGLAKVGQAGNALLGESLSMSASADSSAAAARRNFAGPLDEIGTALRESLGNIVDSMQAGQEFGSTIFNSAENQSALDQAVGEVMAATVKQQAKALAEAPTPEPPAGGWDQMLTEKSGPGPLSALARIGGAFGRGGAGDPILDNARRQTTLLQKIAENTAPKSGAQRVEMVPAYG